MPDMHITLRKGPSAPILARLAGAILVPLLLAGCGSSHSGANQSPHVAFTPPLQTAGPALHFVSQPIAATLYPPGSGCRQVAEGVPLPAAPLSCRDTLSGIPGLSSVPPALLPSQLHLPSQLLRAPSIPASSGRAYGDAFLRTSALSYAGTQSNEVGLLRLLYSQQYGTTAPLFQIWGEYYTVVSVPSCVLPEALRLTALPASAFSQEAGSGMGGTPAGEGKVMVVVATYPACQGLLVRRQSGGATLRYSPQSRRASVVYAGALGDSPFGELFVVAGQYPCGTRAVSAACS